MSDIIYVPIVKTAEAEIRGISYLSDAVKSKITPLFELTRSRTTKNMKKGDIHRRLSKLKEAFDNKKFFLDLTNDPNLSNDQTRELHSNKDGYKSWTDFIIGIKRDFPKIIPIIQISDENVDTEEEHYARIRYQLEALDKEFDNIVYRFPLSYEFIENDLKVICNEVSSKKIICLIDAGYIPQGKAKIYTEKVIEVIKTLTHFSQGLIILCATSFPRSPTEYGDEKNGTMVLEEYMLYKNVCSKLKKKSIIYGDYASINPVRNDQAGGRGWVPRIDMPTENELFYHRSRKQKIEATYAYAYKRVAELLVNENEYKKVKNKIGMCWGINQIESAASGYPQGLSPAFWISVRMNIYISLRVSILR